MSPPVSDSSALVVSFFSPRGAGKDVLVDHPRVLGRDENAEILVCRAARDLSWSEDLHVVRYLE
jgi:ribose 1,5-bisphosphokinase PhnN